MSRKNGGHEEADDQPSAKDGDLVAIWLPDSDLWLLLTGSITTPATTAGQTGISRAWIHWAKRTVTDVGFVPARSLPNPEGLGRADALTLYLCRLMRICDSMTPDGGPVRHSAVELENLVLGAAHVAYLGIDLCRLDDPDLGGSESILRHALHAGVIQAYPAGPERAAQPGSGRALTYGLTMLGKNAVDDGNAPPPFRWSPDEATDASVLKDNEAVEQDDREPTTPPNESRRRQRIMRRLSIEPAPHTREAFYWYGKRLYLGGEQTQISRLFWLLAGHLGHPCPWDMICRDVFSESTNSTPRDPERVRQHVRQVVSKLRSQLKEHKLDDHVFIVSEHPKELPSYTMHLRS